MILGEVGETWELVFIVVMMVVGLGFLIFVQALSQQP